MNYFIKMDHIRWKTMKEVYKASYCCLDAVSGLGLTMYADRYTCCRFWEFILGKDCWSCNPIENYYCFFTTIYNVSSTSFFNWFPPISAFISKFSTFGLEFKQPNASFHRLSEIVDNICGISTFGFYRTFSGSAGHTSGYHSWSGELG